MGKGGGFDDDFVFLTAAQELGIPYTQILDTPEHIIRLAWQGWLAKHDAAMSRGIL